MLADINAVNKQVDTPPCDRMRITCAAVAGRCQSSFFTPPLITVARWTRPILFQIMPRGRPRGGGRRAGLTRAGPYSRRVPRTSSATPAAFPAVSTGGDTHTTSESRSASHRVADLGLDDFVDLIRAVVREEREALLPAVSSSSPHPPASSAASIVTAPSSVEQLVQSVAAPRVSVSFPDSLSGVLPVAPPPLLYSTPALHPTGTRRGVNGSGCTFSGLRESAVHVL